MAGSTDVRMTASASWDEGSSYRLVGEPRSLAFLVRRELLFCCRVGVPSAVCGRVAELESQVLKDLVAGLVAGYQYLVCVEPSAIE
jgi:formate hydrogenlyase subunit 4